MCKRVCSARTRAMPLRDRLSRLSVNPCLNQAPTQFRQRRAPGRWFPIAAVAISPRLGTVSPGHAPYAGRSAVPRTSPYRGNSSLARVYAGCTAKDRNAVTIGTDPAHRVSCPRTFGEKFRSGRPAPPGIAQKADSNEVSTTDRSNPRHLGTSSASIKAKRS